MTLNNHHTMPEYLHECKEQDLDIIDMEQKQIDFEMPGFNGEDVPNKGHKRNQNNNIWNRRRISNTKITGDQ